MSSYYNVSNLETSAADGGYSFYYDGNGNTDFYPFVGFRANGTGALNPGGATASVWYSNPGTKVTEGCRLAYTTSTIILWSNIQPTAGFTVRCVKEQ